MWVFVQATASRIPEGKFELLDDEGKEYCALLVKEYKNSKRKRGSSLIALIKLRLRR